MQERWVVLDEFPENAVSNLGRVMNTTTELVKTIGYNQQGIAYVGMVSDGRQYKRSVAVLVADAFLDPPLAPAFDTPIHLDGDKANCRADNLMWRPRWFAVRYHQQFNRDQFPEWKVPIHVLDTDEIFATPRDMAVAYGVLEKDIHMGVLNHTPVWPIGYDVRYSKE